MNPDRAAISSVVISLDIPIPRYRLLPVTWMSFRTVGDDSMETKSESDDAISLRE